jgi:hypothetical protein
VNADMVARWNSKSYSKPIALCFLVGCGASNYGAPTDTTTIDLAEDGGFSGQFSKGVRVEGTAATYRSGGTTDHAMIATMDVAEIIHALEKIEFLDLDADYTACSNPASDDFSATINVALSAGAHTVRHYLGCSGGVFDDLRWLDQRIYDLSGFTAWRTQL